MEEQETGTLQSAINNGTLVNGNSAPFVSVFRVLGFGKNGGEACTATKILDDSVTGGGDRFLTAGHCVQSILDYGDSEVQLTSANDPTSTSTRSLRNAWVHPSYAAAHLIDGDDAEGKTDVYDVGMFEINDSESAPSWPTALSAGFVADGTTVNFIGYGEDAFSSNGGRKQFGSDTVNGASSPYPIDIDQYSRYVTTDSLFNPHISTAAGNEGDSGGPLYTGFGFTAQLRGVLASSKCFLENSEDECDFAAGTETRFARVSNVLRWLQNPNNLDESTDLTGAALVATNSEVFVQNRGERACISHVTSGQPIVLAECGQVGVPQNYRLILREGTDLYALQNTTSGQCLRITGASNEIIPFNCSSTSLFQRFRVDQSAFPRIRLRPRNFSSQCLTFSSGRIRRATCNASSANQDWFIYR